MPRHAVEGGKRFPLGMRTTKATREKLEAAAKASGRSLAQEVEHRLEQSFEADKQAATLVLLRIIRTDVLAIREATDTLATKAE